MLNRKTTDIGIVSHVEHGKTTIDAAMMIIANKNNRTKVVVVEDENKNQLNLNDIIRTEPVIIRPYYQEQEPLSYKCGREKRKDRRKNNRKKQ